MVHGVGGSKDKTMQYILSQSPSSNLYRTHTTTRTTTGPSQGREGEGISLYHTELVSTTALQMTILFGHMHNGSVHWRKQIGMAYLICTSHCSPSQTGGLLSTLDYGNLREDRHGLFNPSLTEGEDTPHALLTSQMSRLLSASPPLTTGAQLDTGLRDHSQQHSNPGHSPNQPMSVQRREAKGARAGCPTEGGLRVQGLVVQWREV